MLPLTLPSPVIPDGSVSPIMNDDSPSDDHGFQAISSSEGRNPNSCHRKRPKYTRSKAGCLTCRTKKIKCDESHPRCTRCINAQRDCTWPQNPAVTKKSQAAEKRKRELRANSHVDNPVTLLPTSRSTLPIGSALHIPPSGSQDSTLYLDTPESDDNHDYMGIRGRRTSSYTSPPTSDSSEHERERPRVGRNGPLDPVTNLSEQPGSRDQSPQGFSFAAAPDVFGPHPPHALAAHPPHGSHPPYASHYDPRRSPTPTATNPYFNYNRGVPQHPPAFYPFVPGFNAPQLATTLPTAPKLPSIRQPPPQPSLLPFLSNSPPHNPLTLPAASESENTPYSSLLFPPSPTTASSSISPTSATFSIGSSAPSLTQPSNSASPSSDSTHIDLESFDLDIAGGVASSTTGHIQNLDERADVGLGLGLGYGTGGVQGLTHWNGPGPEIPLASGGNGKYATNEYQSQQTTASGAVFGPSLPPSAYPPYATFADPNITEPAQTYTAHAAAAAIAPQMFSTPDPLEPFFHTVQERSLVGSYAHSPHNFSTPPPFAHHSLLSGIAPIRPAESDVRLRSHAIAPLLPLDDSAGIPKVSMRRHSPLASAKR